MEEIHGAVNIKAPVEVVQVALKGLLGYKGIETPESYSFDRYRIKQFTKTPEGKNLSNLLINFKTLELDLASTSSETTELNYKFETRGLKSPIPIMLLSESAILLVIGIIVQLMTPIFAIAISVISYVFGILLAVLVFAVFVPSGGKLEKNLHKMFLPRLDKYIDIVKDHLNEQP